VWPFLHQMHQNWQFFVITPTAGFKSSGLLVIQDLVRSIYTSRLPGTYRCWIALSGTLGCRNLGTYRRFMASSLAERLPLVSNFPLPIGSSRCGSCSKRLLRPVQSTFGLRKPERTRVLKRTELSNDQSHRHLGLLSDGGRQGNQRAIRANGRSRLASQKSPVVMFLRLCVQRQAAAVGVLITLSRQWPSPHCFVVYVFVRGLWQS
jgi:hypothetical protein